MGDLTKNFSRSEFACKCGCGFDDIDLELVGILQSVRLFLGVPLHVNSGCRCEEHNKKVGGVANSWHTKGKAADISCELGAKKIWDAARQLYDNGKIQDLKWCRWYKRKNFVHFDVGKTRNKIFAIQE